MPNLSVPNGSPASFPGRAAATTWKLRVRPKVSAILEASSNMGHSVQKNTFPVKSELIRMMAV
jgi:hypothetical protein